MTDVSSKVSTKPSLYFEDVEIIACSIFDPTMMYIAGRNSIVYHQKLSSESIKNDRPENDNTEEKSASTISEFQPRKWIPSRKLIKLMTRQVQIGVSAIGGVVSVLDGWDEVDPSRRGLFIAFSAACLALSSPEALPVPIIADPISDITVLTSEKSTFIIPGLIIRSAIP